jgi:hypothetical protein
MRTTFHTVLVVAATTFLTLTGCRKDPTEPQLVFPTGNYQLSTINGSELPYLYPNTTHTTVDGSFNFVNGGSWELHSRNCEVLPCNESNAQDDHVVGTYTISGTTITFQETSPGSLRFDGDFSTDAARLTLDVDHPRLGPSLRVYRKP